MVNAEYIMRDELTTLEYRVTEKFEGDKLTVTVSGPINCKIEAREGCVAIIRGYPSTDENVTRIKI